MSVRVAINGFGRIGRNVFRAARERGAGFEIVAVNDLMDPPMAAHLLRYDTVHGRFRGEVEAADDGLVVDGRDVRVLSQRDPADLPWAEMGSRSSSSRPGSSPSARRPPSTSPPARAR